MILMTILIIAFVTMLIIAVPLMGMGLGIGFLIFGDVIVMGVLVWLIIRKWIRKRR
jgi:hypothetical protein